MRHETIFRLRNSEPLTMDEMQARVPAIFAPAPHASRSDRYVYIDSVEVLQGIMAEGFEPVEVRASRCRDAERRPFTKHMICFRKPDGGGTRKVGDVSYEVIMRNAHDGTGSYELSASLFRLVCLNGMRVPESTVDVVRVQHRGDTNKVLHSVIDGAYAVLDGADKVIDATQTWKSITLLPDEQEALAVSAHHLRFADAQGETHTAIEPRQLLHPRRFQDSQDVSILGLYGQRGLPKPNLWTTFNVIQENTIRGGLSAIGRDARNRPRRTTTREVRGIDQDVKLNRALWLLAENMAKIKVPA